MKKKIFSQPLLGIIIAGMVVSFLPTFSQSNVNASAQTEGQLMTIKNESGKAIREIIAYDRDDNPLHLLSKKLKTGQLANVKLTCGYLYIKYQFDTKKACDWGEIDVCKNNMIIIKKSCPIEALKEQDKK